MTRLEKTLVLCGMTLIISIIFGLISYDAYLRGYVGVGPQDTVTLGMWRSDVVLLCGYPDESRYIETANGVTLIETYRGTYGQNPSAGCRGQFTYYQYRITQIAR